MAAAFTRVFCVNQTTATFCRRRNYELFLFTHYASWFFLATALLHAWTFWYFAIGSLLLYAFDKLRRVCSAALRVERIAGLSYASGITKLTVDASVIAPSCSSWLWAFVGTASRPRHVPGQFAFLHIPAIDALQWHPFTISSPPVAESPGGAGGLLSFHIRDMGPGTWTCRLAELARSRAAAVEAGGPAPPLPLISIDGPYGNQGRYFEHEVAVFIAGGIGVTAFASILQALIADARNKAARGLPPVLALRRVHFVWVVRSRGLCAEFDDFLCDLLDCERDFGAYVRVSVDLYVTRAAGAAEELVDGGVLSPSTEGSSASPSRFPYPTSPTSESTTFITRPSFLPLKASSAPRWLASMTTGRPDLPSIFRCVASELEPQPDVSCCGHGDDYNCLRSTRIRSATTLFCGPLERVVVLACGPQPMTAEAATLSASHGFAFHVEHFLF